MCGDARLFGGGGIRANNYLVDGFPVTDLQNRASTNPTIEAVEEFLRPGSYIDSDAEPVVAIRGKAATYQLPASDPMMAPTVFAA